MICDLVEMYESCIQFKRKNYIRNKFYEPEFFLDLYFTDGRRGEKYKADMIREALKSIVICVKLCTNKL